MTNPVLNALGDDLLYGGAVDPRVTPLDAPRGAIYIFSPDTVAPEALLQKTDDGLSTNWTSITTGGAGKMDTNFGNAIASIIDLDLGGNQINNLADPTLAQDAATKNYIDSNFATIALDNLSGVAINADLDPDSDNTRDLGAIGTAFKAASIYTVNSNSFSVRDASLGVTGDVRGSAVSLPSGASADMSVRTSVVAKTLGIFTNNNTAADAVASSSLFIESGNKTAGTGDSGNITLQIGTSAGGSRGTINFVDGSEGTPGDVWTSQGVNGEGAWAAPSGGSGTQIYTFFADQLDSPNNANWTVNSLAPANQDSLNNALVVRAFDDTTEEGVGFSVDIPTGVTNITFNFKSRAQTAPGAARTVGLNIYRRAIPNNGAVSAWSAATQLTDIDIPTNTNFQYDSQTLTLASLGLTAGQLHQFELTRVNPTGGTELVGDWNLLLLEVSFS